MRPLRGRIRPDSTPFGSALFFSTILATFVLTAAALLAAEPPEAKAPQPVNVPMLVQFQADAVRQLCGGETGIEAAAAKILPKLDVPPDTILIEPPVSQMLRLEKDGGLDFGRWMVLQFHLPPPLEREAVEAIAAKLRENPLVTHAEPDYDVCKLRAPGGQPAAAAAATETQEALIPNDILFRQQYYHHLIQTPQAWNITTGSEEVIVAVLDTGCTPGLDDFAGRVYPGYDFLAGDVCTGDKNGHGTAITALIAAKGNNRKGIAGMDWNCRILPINAAAAGIAAWVQAIEYAAFSEVQVLNISARLDIPEPSALIEQALALAEENGVIIVVSAGNQGQPSLAFPAASEHVLAVGAIDQTNRRWTDPALHEASNYGPGLDIVAPGYSIVSIGNDGKRVCGGGTSFAAPLVSGACALMCAVNPSLSPARMRAILCETADKFEPASQWDKNGFCEEFGHGRLNVYKAVMEAKRFATP